MPEQPYEENVKSFLKRQRDWFLERDDHRCSFLYHNDGKWHRCNHTNNLEAHHILPRGWYKEHSSRLWDVNGPENGLILCQMHHRGKGATFSDRYIIHPDNQDALDKHRKGNDDAFSEMKERRYELNSRGIPYWQTNWDWLFYRIVKRRNQQRDVQYPYRGGSSDEPNTVLPDYMREDGDQSADLF